MVAGRSHITTFAVESVLTSLRSAIIVIGVHPATMAAAITLHRGRTARRGDLILPGRTPLRAAITTLSPAGAIPPQVVAIRRPAEATLRLAGAIPVAASMVEAVVAALTAAEAAARTVVAVRTDATNYR